MAVPPGIELLVKDVLPRALGRPLLIAGILKLVQYQAGTTWPNWYWVVPVLCVHPAAWLLSKLRGQYQRRREAAARGAIFPPRVQKSSFQIAKALAENSRTGYMGEVFHGWTKQYGNTYLLQIFGNWVMTVEPEHIKAIFATQFDDFFKGPMEEDQFNSLLGSGVFNSDGDMWKFHRNMTRPFFSKVRITDFELFERHAEDALSLLADRLASGAPVDFQDIAARFTLDSATEFLSGKSVSSLSAGLPYPASHPLANSASIDFRNHPSTKFVNALTDGQAVIALRSIYGRYWRLLEFWKDKASTHRKAMEDFVLPILDSAMENRKNDVVSGEVKEIEDETFLEHLVTLTEDKKVVMDELLNILIAARDTTASLLTFSIYALSQRPDIVSRLKTEINERVGNRRPTYEDTRDMKYLRAFLNEVLRLYPPVPNNIRISRVSTTLPNKGGRPWCIPKDTLFAFHVFVGIIFTHSFPSYFSVIYSVFLMHRREDLWGPDALEFDPDRFLDERLHKYLTPNPFIFLPFNAGPRICLGQQFAYNEASYFMIKLLQKFTDFTLALDVQPSQPPKEWILQPGTTKGRDKVMLKSHLTMFVKDGLWVRMKTSAEQKS
ncbi:hypothetical protein D9758_013948 [Tetrapyrgos nigripes]|uniref:Cytochrome P450 n=1 Tax=Tetrapyrgos nigripes TaxID=182062 RepID=A0A8H5CHA9_9AGAR|nr:hypothetical protein D9758_013948 [Tetrapyrgos nigripes]